MTLKGIERWVFDHVNSGMKRRVDWNNETDYKMTFENGDTYGFKERGNGYDEKTVTISINGKEENTTKYIYDFNKSAWSRAI